MIGIRKRPRKRSRVIDWEAMANGGWWTLRPGVDHEQDCRKALRAARTWALGVDLVAQAELPAKDAPFETPWHLRFHRRGDTSA